MATYDDFKNSILPGNYALTKSYELTKVETSGTLWYTKKFLVLYYYIFLSRDIMTRAYIQKVVDAFDNYINSLPENIREEATRFFYSDSATTDFRSEHFISFISFAGRTDFENEAERRVYYYRARKSYFMLLMDVGGQTGVKKILKESLASEGFVYSSESLREIMIQAAIESAVNDANNFHKMRDNSIKRLLSEEVMDNLVELSEHETVSVEDAEELNNRFPKDSPEYAGIENDMVAFIRNERQILYYYGYFHSRSSGADGMEFSSLTPVGELALVANAFEFLAVWEHQKLKMISQPETADINNIIRVDNDANNFAISATPYLNILGHLVRKNTLSLKEYQYIVSRKNYHFTDEEWLPIENEVLTNIDEIVEMVNGFGRNADVKKEDFEKELKKYILGIRELPFDSTTNDFACCNLNRRLVTCTNVEKLNTIYDAYGKMSNYKLAKYGELFGRCSEDLKTRYMGEIRGQGVPINDRTKIDWDLYNIRVDRFILGGVLVTMAAASLGIGRDNVDLITAYLFAQNCNKVLGYLNIRHTQTSIRRFVREIVTFLNAEDYAPYVQYEEERAPIVARYREMETAALQRRIEEISAEANVNPGEVRERNRVLIQMMKSLYMQRYLQNNTLKCECCGGDAFIQESGDPYIEFHHLIPFNFAYGPDHQLNIFAICPTCHRKLHYIALAEKERVYGDLSGNNYRHQSIVNRLRELKDADLLRTYHLEFLLVDKAISQEEYNAIAA